MARVRSGRLNQSIQIQRYSSVEDSFGQQTKTYTTLLTARAEVQVASETENIAGGKYDGRTLYNIYMRFTDVEKKDRIVWNSKNLEVLQVQDKSNRKRELTLLAWTDD